MIVALYARVSTSKQAEKDLSIPDQLKQMRDWCKAKDFSVGKEYIEAGASATDDRRPVFQAMINEATQSPEPYQAIIIHSLSRFFRDSLEFGLYQRQLEKHGIKVLSITQQTSDDPSGEMARKIFTVFDEYQSKENGKHTLRAMKENTSQGYFNGSTAPYGYRVIEVEKEGRRGKKKKLAVDKSEASIVKKIFELCIYGYKGESLGLTEITSYLNRKGIARRGPDWAKNRVYEILQNSVYINEYYFNKKDRKNKRLKPKEEWVQLQVEPIIDIELFDKARIVLTRRSPKVVPPRIVNSPTLLTGLVKCGRCGAGMARATGKSNRYRYYKCQTKVAKGANSCSTKEIPMKKLDGIILTALAEKVFTYERVKTILEKLQKRMKKGKSTNGRRIKELSSELTKNKKKTWLLLEAVENGDIPSGNILREKAKRLEVQRQELLLEIASLKQEQELRLDKLTPNHIKAFCKAFKKRMENIKSGLGKGYIKLLISEIKVMGSEVLMSGNSRNLAYAVANQGVVNGSARKVSSFVPNWLPGTDSNRRQGG